MTPTVDRFLVALMVLLSLVALWLVLNTPASYLNVNAVYQRVFRK